MTVLAVMRDTSWLIVAIVLITAGIAAQVIGRWMERRPITQVDEYCARMDQALDDELFAQSQVRPYGNVVPLFPGDDGNEGGRDTGGSGWAA